MPANIHTNKLFPASRIALIATAMTFAFRAGVEGIWGNLVFIIIYVTKRNQELSTSQSFANSIV